MIEYKSVTIDAQQGWGGAKGTMDTETLDMVLNRMARDGWRLTCMEDLHHTAGTQCLLCVFQRDKATGG